VGTARQAADLVAALCFAFLKLTQAANTTLLAMESPRPTPRPKNLPCHHQSPSRPKAILSTGC